MAAGEAADPAGGAGTGSENPVADPGSPASGPGNTATATSRPPVDPFDVPGVRWHPVSPRLATVRRIVWSVFWAVLAVVPVVLAAVLGRWSLAWIVLVPVVAWAWGWWIIGRQVSAWAYAERSEELLVRAGRQWRRLVVVPYGRLQYVDVEVGPLARAFGLASVQLHTASAGTDAQIPGLPAADAAQLRDRLTERGQAQLAGL